MGARLSAGLALLACAASLWGCSARETRAPKSMVELRSRGAVLQAHEYSCGAAALATLMYMFGRPVKEMEVLDSIFGRELPKVRGLDGRLRLRALSLGDLEAAARGFGFKVVSLQVPDEQSLGPVLRALKPVIARMHLYKEYPHFVVVRDIQDEWVHISDPAYGNVKLSTRQFFESWEAGDRVLMTIGRHPFYAWKLRDDKPVYLRRNEKDEIQSREDVSPRALYQSVHRRLSQIGSWPR